jgi:cyclophilin family peptidyl-prolyl cis-trans isomerase
MKRQLLFAFFLLSSLMVVPHTQSQLSGAAVTLVCDEVLLLDDSLSFGQDSFECTVSNPTAYVEKIIIGVQSSSVFTDSPEDLYVGAGDDVTFEVNVSWQEGLFSIDTITQYITVTASVQELNNLPPPNTAYSTRTITIDPWSAYRVNGCWTNGSLQVEYVHFTIEHNNSLSNLTIELDHSSSPVHATNFGLLSAMKCFNDTIFHRVIDNFMIQGGDFTNADGTGGHAAFFAGYCNGQTSTDSNCSGQGHDAWTIPDETNNGLLHSPCTISMAKTSQANTGGSQFFLIPEDSNNGLGPFWLDGVHTVFGTVTSGCDYVTSLSEVDTASNDKPMSDIKIVDVFVTGLWADTDSDGVSDSKDNCPLDSNADQLDLDGDGVGDVCDDDLDGDGTNNSEDAFPNDANETNDDDGDGVGNNSDAFPQDANETHDDDGDGVGNNSDAFPQDANETHDDDGDGVGNNSDAFPQDANETLDTDGDGVGDNADADPQDPEIRYQDDIQINISDRSSYLISASIIILALVLFFRRPKTPNQAESSPFVDESDSIWSENL